MDVLKLVENIYDEVVEIRRDLHKYPELSEQEFRTAKKICEKLDQYNISYVDKVAGNGIVATIYGDKVIENQRFKVVAVRADMDALPITELTALEFKSQNKGIMHACGHDIHTAVMLGTAKLLNSMKSEFSGCIKFFFQPAEESIGGAERMIESGCMEDPKVDAVIGLHVTPTLESGCVEFCPGKMNAASTEFEIIVNGESCHGAHPDNGIDSILTACHMVTALQSIVSRNLDPAEPGLITVGQFHSGNRNNIIPKDATISGIIRTLDNDTQALIKQNIIRTAKNTAQAFGANADIYFEDSYPALVNDSLIQKIIQEVAFKHLKKSDIYFMEKPSMGSEDFSYFSKHARSLFFNIGCKFDGDNSNQALHSEYFCPDENCMKTGILMEVLGVLAILDFEGEDDE